MPVSNRSQSADDERDDEIEALREQIRTKCRRLNLLKLQEAKFGISVDPAIIIQIEDLEREIAALDRQVRDLGG